MRKLALISGLVFTSLVFSATAACADCPLHDKTSVSGTFVAAAGDLCDFNYHQDFTDEVRTALTTADGVLEAHAEGELRERRLNLRSARLADDLGL